ncbi:MAG TPA: hypothetical protein VNQ15_18320, partial [Verrucomicrobiae bacterium]|nr:hypothetical protein [Verrucomicrobiae bacterium]
MKITFPLESGAWHGFATERMWAQKVSDQERWGQVLQSNTLVEMDSAEQRGESPTLAASARASGPPDRAPAADPPPRVCGQYWGLDITH